MRTISEHKQSWRDTIESAAEQFMKAGGRIEVLPGPTLAPAPPRRHPVGVQKKARRPSMPAHVARYRTYGPRLIELREQGLTIAEAGKRIGKSNTFVVNCLEYFGIDTAEAAPRKPPSHDPELVEKIRTMAENRYTMRYTAQCLDIPLGRVKHLSGWYCIRFGR